MRGLCFRSSWCQALSRRLRSYRRDAYTSSSGARRLRRRPLRSAPKVGLRSRRRKRRDRRRSVSGALCAAAPGSATRSDASPALPQFGQGGVRPEVLAAASAAGSASGGTGALLARRQARLLLTCYVPAAYLNLEPVHGVSAGESASVSALCDSGVTRVVVGLLHPLPRLRGQAVAALQAAGICVDVPCELDTASSASSAAALTASRRVNEALLHRAATGQPFSVWKYAMTLDGKIATRTGHSAWVSGACLHTRRH